MNLSGDQKGLSQLLAGACTFEECLLQVDGTFVIPAGRSTDDLDPTTAFMMGKLKVDGSMGIAMKLQGLLG